MIKLLSIPVAAIVLSVPHQRTSSTTATAQPDRNRIEFNIENDIRSFDTENDPMVEELKGMQKELQLLREQAVTQALEELKELDAQIAELEAERTKVLDRIKRIEEQCALPATIGKKVPLPDYQAPRSPFRSAL